VDFPILDLLDEQACFDFLVDALHPQGLRRPGCRGSRNATHRSRRDPVLDYRCASRGAGGRGCNARKTSVIEVAHDTSHEHTGR